MAPVITHVVVVIGGNAHVLKEIIGQSIAQVSSIELEPKELEASS
jgi:hypothetical protein